MSISRRGLRIIPPEYVGNVMARARQHKRDGTRWSEEEKRSLWPVGERARIRAITSCKILQQRYPSPSDGKRFMESVDYQRREELLGYAKELTGEIVSSWESINPEKPIAVIIFGSVAKGLVKDCHNGDPSNIDLAVIVEIRGQEEMNEFRLQREMLLDAIRDKRHEIQQRILAPCPKVNSIDKNPGNAGVFVQDISKLEKGNYGSARNYISSGAIALHDPARIWARVEEKALQAAAKKFKLDKKSRGGIVFSSAERFAN